jgi:hypothetical protein
MTDFKILIERGIPLYMVVGVYLVFVVRNIRDYAFETEDHPYNI